MAYFTSNTYKMKRKILSFSNKILKDIVECLSRHLEKGASTQAASSYLQMIKKWVPKVLHQKAFTKKVILLRKPVC